MTELNRTDYNAVLFDLDGTLVDTAPDMVAALQVLQQEYGIEPAPYEIARTFVSHGAIGLLTLGFQECEVSYGNELHHQFLEIYASMICVKSRLFSGLNELLNVLDASDFPWGIVTNKPEQLTLPLLIELNLAERSSCIVSGDTLPVRKPEPDPVLLGCEILGTSPELSIYVGDAERDIEAGRRAGTATIAAGYGYINDEEDPREWGADIIAETTDELKQIILNSINGDANEFF